nr:unnamed protein product [Callosobruchus analis]
MTHLFVQPRTGFSKESQRQSAPSEYSRSPRNSLVPDQYNRSPRNSLVPEPNRTPRHSLTPDNGGIYGSRLSIAEYSRSPRNSLLPDGSRTPRQTLTPSESATWGPDEVPIMNRSPRHSITPDAAGVNHRSPRGSIAPDCHSLRTSPRGSIAGEYQGDRMRGRSTSPYRSGSRGNVNVGYNPGYSELGQEELLPEEVREELLEMKAVSPMKDDFHILILEQFWVKRLSVNSKLASLALRVLIPFSLTYSMSGDEQRRLCASAASNAAANSHRGSSTISGGGGGITLALTTYGSVAYQLKDANLEANSTCDFVCKALSIVNKTVIVTIVLVCLSILPLIMLIMECGIVVLQNMEIEETLKYLTFRCDKIFNFMLHFLSFLCVCKSLFEYFSV